MAREVFATVVAVSQDGIRDLERTDPAALWTETLERVDFATSGGADIVCLPECCAGREPQCVPGPATESLSAFASRARTWVIVPLLVRQGDRVTNSAVLLDRSGNLAGRYDKIHLTEDALGRGQTPGDRDPPVFETDFGVIGVQICFDVNWRDAWARLGEKGARVLFFPAAYPAARQLGALAWMHEYYVVSATMSRTSRIYDISGDVLASSGMFHEWARARLCLGKRLFELDYQIGASRDIERKYGDRVLVTWHSEEDWFTLESRDPELAVEDVIREFGLVPKRAYHARCEEANTRRRGA